MNIPEPPLDPPQETYFNRFWSTSKVYVCKLPSRWLLADKS